MTQQAIPLYPSIHSPLSTFAHGFSYALLQCNFSNLTRLLLQPYIPCAFYLTFLNQAYSLVTFAPKQLPYFIT
jgi:hypothetical protein